MMIGQDVAKCLIWKICQLGPPAGMAAHVNGVENVCAQDVIVGHKVSCVVLDISRTEGRAAGELRQFYKVLSRTCVSSLGNKQ